MEEQKNQEERQNVEKEDAYTVKKRTLDLLPDAENNIAKLQVYQLHMRNWLSQPKVCDFLLNLCRLEALVK